MNEISVGGFVPLTTIDYPDHLAAVVFCQGCPYQCHYCHNPALISRTNSSKPTWYMIKEFLLKRKGLLEGVVFSGGEPTLQRHLFEAISYTKELGFKIGLHTSGSYPVRFKKLLPVLDWVGFDVKAPISEYHSVTTVKKSGIKAYESLRLLLESDVVYEIRTTIHPKLHSREQIMEMAAGLKKMGVINYKLQKFRKEGCNNSYLKSFDFAEYITAKDISKLRSSFQQFTII